MDIQLASDPGIDVLFSSEKDTQNSASQIKLTKYEINYALRALEDHNGTERIKEFILKYLEGQKDRKMLFMTDGARLAIGSKQRFGISVFFNAAGFRKNRFFLKKHLTT